MKSNKKGFTLVEIMIVVAIIGIIGAIAVPSLIGARQTARRNICLMDMRKIEEAIHTRLSVEGDVGVSLNMNQGELGTFLVPDYLRTMPSCPSGGTYSSEGTATVIEVHCTIHNP